MSEWFEYIRAKKKIPIVELRQSLVPGVQALVDDQDLFGLLSALQSKDDYTYRHPLAVSVISGLLGEWMGLERMEVLQLTTAALLHDVGKMLIPSALLDKPGPLTAEEYTVIKEHTIHGYQLMRGTLGVSYRQALVALQHHEHNDGSGYPFGLKGDKIDLFSRIVAVADMFHAMMSNRVYQNPSPFYEVLYEIDRGAYGQLDPAITKLFNRKLMERLQGNRVQLTDGREGRVMMVPVHDPLSPLVQVGPEFVDLRTDRAVRIHHVL